jgi:Lon protease-like protein
MVPVTPYPMFPLSTVLLPGEALALRVFEPRYRRMIADCMDGDGTFGVVLIARGSEVGGGDERLHVGTVAAIEDVTSAAPDGRFSLRVRGSERIRVERWLADDPYPKAEVAPFDEGDEPSAALRSAVHDARRALRRVQVLSSELGYRWPPEWLELLAGPPPASGGGDGGGRGTAGGGGAGEDVPSVSWALCAVAPLQSHDRQQLLETEGTVARLERLRRFADDRAMDLERMLAAGAG